MASHKNSDKHSLGFWSALGAVGLRKAVSYIVGVIAEHCAMGASRE